MSDYRIVQGDCVEVMRRLPDASIDAIVCDPPAAISFMGKEWDDDKGGREGWVGWMTEVMREALRVLRPGGHAVVWALPRTSHWTAWALEDAGFEVRDAVLHCFGTGFPKSLDISKSIDASAGAERKVVGQSRTVNQKTSISLKASKMHEEYGTHVPITAPTTDAAKKWAGWGSNLKPSQEVWWLCRKPFDGTIAANTLKHGVGGLNIDGCRVATSHGDEVSLHGRAPTENGWDARWSCAQTPGQTDGQKLGRFPANLLLSHSPSCVHLDTADDTDLWACVPGCPIRALDAQSGESKSTKGKPRKSKESGDGWGMTATGAEYEDTGGASRFFMRFDPNDAPFIYQAKANTKDRSAGVDGRNSHPTVKSTALMAYLCRLVTPPGGLVLDPFMGSGSTGVACMKEGFNFLGIEKEAEYVEIAEARIAHAAKEASDGSSQS